ncbi:FAD-binding oxidoreductase [Mangrovihabitans endophyticus]|uniref:Glycolate oxidase n=1 Tax=Mangrovihabitans endophyticus TaxID=1751298 RepID=A0A8J3C1Q3_9ACTN|nr:FAD-binding oxidoreductase [Mangrovihabitans endophyticus]GGK97413.1 glycolate oxidase [Mangrovihabitans endophyticus]
MGEKLPSREPLLHTLRDICGPDFARTARAVDRVAGGRVSFVATPATADAVSAVMRLADERGLAVKARGSGSKIDWGRPPRGVDLIVDTARLNGLWDHRAEDRTVEVATGTPVHALQAALALRGQRLAVDPPSRTATVGGMLAVNESGPLRHRFGSPAEFVDRVSYVDMHGLAADSDGEDGRPGIAEIDGVLLSARLRLQAAPAASRWVTVPAATPLQVHHVTEQVLALSLGESAIEMDLPAPAAARDSTPPRGTVAVLVEGDATDVTDRAARLVRELGDESAAADAAPSWWGRYPFEAADVALRISAATADLHAAVYALSDALRAPVAVRGSVGYGRVHAVLPGGMTAEEVTAALESVRQVLLARGGRVVAIVAPPALARQIDIAGREDLF